jgi:protein dpy-30
LFTFIMQETATTMASNEETKPAEVTEAEAKPAADAGAAAAPDAAAAAGGDKPAEPAAAGGDKPAEPAAAAATLTPAKEADKPAGPLPVRQYLEGTVVPILMQGMQQLVKERPGDPIEWIADFLHKNNPKKRKIDATA